jgi:hypothetical protein
VLLLGDSIMGQASPTAEALLTGQGMTVLARGISGSAPVPLPNSVDWPTEAGVLGAQFHPDVVVILFTGNYTRLVNLNDDAALCHAWGDAVRQMAAELLAGGARRVIVAESVPGEWLIPPDQAFACETLALVGVRGADVADAGGVLGAPGSPRTRVEALPACDGGAPVVLRTADIHSTQAGASRVGRALAATIDPAGISAPPAFCADRAPRA